MSRKITNTTIRTTQKLVESVTCDLCGNEHRGAYEGYDKEVVWNYEAFDVTETCISIKTGYMYPEGGGGDLLWADVCGDCFNDKVVPALKAIGVIFQEETWGV